MGEWFRVTGYLHNWPDALKQAEFMASRDSSSDYRIMEATHRIPSRWYVARRLINNQQVMRWEYAR